MSTHINWVLIVTVCFVITSMEINLIDSKTKTNYNQWGITNKTIILHYNLSGLFVRFSWV